MLFQLLNMQIDCQLIGLSNLSHVDRTQSMGIEVDLNGAVPLLAHAMIGKPLFEAVFQVSEVGSSIYESHRGNSLFGLQ